MAGLVNILSGQYTISGKLSSFVIAPIDDDGKIDETLGGAKTLQYWPESFSDSKGANFQPKDILGAPLPIYQWTNGSERQFGFQVVFSRDIDGKIPDEVDEDKFNVDVDAAIAWLKMLSMNDYVGGFAVAPPVCWMWLEGTDLGYNRKAAAIQRSGLGGNAGVHVFINQADAERTNWFQTGTTRYATVSITCVETMQIGADIYPYGRSDMLELANKYGRKYNP